MYWILTHYWITASMVVILVAGLVWTYHKIITSRQKTYPLPKRNQLPPLSGKSTLKKSEPLLIRLPKLGV